MPRGRLAPALPWRLTHGPARSHSIRGGQGEKVERLYREVRAYAIPGGSEEILLDLGIRQAMKAAVTARAKM